MTNPKTVKVGPLLLPTILFIATPVVIALFFVVVLKGCR